MRIVSLLPVIVFASACGVGASATGPETSRSFAVGGFDSVELAGSDNVDVVQGTRASVVAAGSPEALDRLDIHVDGTTLKVGRKRQWGIGWSRDGGARVTVTTPALKGAAVAGSGTMHIDKARADRFSAAVSGSGNLEIGRLDSINARVAVAGSGTARATGRVGDAKLSIAGSGDIDMRSVLSDTVDISIAGSGNAFIAARGSSRISIAGSGDAVVTGTTNCTVKRVGSGRGRCSA